MAIPPNIHHYDYLEEYSKQYKGSGNSLFSREDFVDIKLNKGLEQELTLQRTKTLFLEDLCKENSDYLIKLIDELETQGIFETKLYGDIQPKTKERWIKAIIKSLEVR